MKQFWYHLNKWKLENKIYPKIYEKIYDFSIGKNWILYIFGHNLTKLTINLDSMPLERKNSKLKITFPALFSPAKRALFCRAPRAFLRGRNCQCPRLSAREGHHLPGLEARKPAVGPTWPCGAHGFWVGNLVELSKKWIFFQALQRGHQTEGHDQHILWNARIFGWILKFVYN